MNKPPARIIPPEAPLGRAAFIARFVRNPLAVVPAAAFREDFVPSSGPGPAFAWVTGPELIRAVLLEERERFRKAAQIRLLGPLLGKGILTSEGEDWKWQRQAAAPMFRREELLAFVPAFVAATERLVARWRARGRSGVRPVDRDMVAVTFDVISATLLPSADRTVAPAIESSTAMFQRSGAWAQLLAVANAPRWLSAPMRWRSQGAIRRLRGAVAAMLEERRATEAASGGAPDDLMHRLVRARDPETGQAMDQERLIDNLLTFYLAGHETTARALTWTLYLLALAPGWAARLEEEVGRVTGGAPLEPAHLERLVLVQQVLKESMRLYPPVPLMSRQADADGPLGGREVRAGTSVVLPIYAIHRHARRWASPDDFDPERFSPEREAAIPRYHYMPFGAGPRICIGMGFAMIEAAAILATLLQRARFAPSPGLAPEPVARVTLLPRGGMPLEVSLR